ncbi:MAG: RnfABCDGE type electron transport complex subunit D [Eubacteriales bacterium]
MVKSSPFIHSSCTTSAIYRWAMVGFVPAILAMAFFQVAGFGVLVTCSITSFLAQMWSNYRANLKILDISALITGVTMGLMLPMDCPTWACILASLVSIFGVKTLFGGMGKNWFNPACAGVALLLCFPSLWGTALEGAQGQFLWGYFGGGLAEVSSVLLLIGAGFLVWKRLARWQIFVPYLAGVAVASLFLGANLVAVLVWGGTLFGAFYLSSDPVTSPVDSRWHPLYGLFAGIFATSFAYFLPAMGGVALGIICTNLLGRLADFLSS